MLLGSGSGAAGTATRLWVRERRAFEWTRPYCDKQEHGDRTKEESATGRAIAMRWLTAG